jgi:hypothetical protein
LIALFFLTKTNNRRISSALNPHIDSSLVKETKEIVRLYKESESLYEKEDSEGFVESYLSALEIQQRTVVYPLKYPSISVFLKETTVSFFTLRISLFS